MLVSAHVPSDAVPDDLPPIGEILVGWPADRETSRPGHRGRPNGPFSTFGFLRVTTDPASLVLVGRDGMRPGLGEIRWDGGGAAGPRAAPGRRCLRIGGCTPPAGRLRPQAVRGGRTSPRASAMAGGVGHLHESTVTGGHHDGPDNLTPRLLPLSHRTLLPNGVPPGCCPGGRAQRAQADRRPGIRCTGRSGPPPLP